ncbi:MAG: CNNM domain-containing protein [Actinomycetota bacterium]|nr:CNNM domain-containing protein [Actinomycetota bacterium]
MDEIIFAWLKLAGALLLVAMNGLFVAAEFAFTKVRATKVESMVREARASAGLVKEAARDLDAYLAVCQVGITIASLALGALGEPWRSRPSSNRSWRLSASQATPCALSPSS